MQPDKNNKQTTIDTDQAIPKENLAGGNSNVDENVRAALEVAENDISNDPDLSIHSPNDDLDEGELSRLGDDGAGLV